MKKLLCIFLSLILTVPLCACKQEDSPPTLYVTAPESTLPVTIPEETAAQTPTESTAVVLAEETTTATIPESTEATVLPEESVATAPTEITLKKDFSFEDLKYTAFHFSSGAGAWRTVLTILSDGSFTGEYSDSNMGENGEGYPEGSVYCSNFTGKFSQPVMVNAYTYSITLEELTYRRQPGTKEIIDNTMYYYTDAYGLYGAKEFLIYLPGSPLQELPESFLSWTNLIRAEETHLSCYGLYAPENQNGFSSYDTLSWIRVQVSIRESADRSLESSLQEAETQAEINALAHNRYRLWDDFLNELWAVLKQALDKGTMHSLTLEELDWIEEKEQAIAEAGSAFAGGSLYSTVAADIATRMTRDRVYELLEYLP